MRPFLTNRFLTYKTGLREDQVQKDRQAILQRYLGLQKIKLVLNSDIVLYRNFKIIIIQSLRKD